LRRCFLFLLLVCLSLGSIPVFADVTGTLLGTVRDASGGVVATAKVTATDNATGLRRQTTTNASGEYRLLALPTGRYSLHIEASGFEAFEVHDIDLTVNAELRFDATLQVGSVEVKVDVNANAVQVETSSTQLGQVIEQKQILALPLNGRSFIDLLGLQAGVAPGSSGAVPQDRPASGFLSAGNVSVNGQRESSNAFYVNGGDVNEGRNMGASVVPNLDSIAEFRLITNSFDAEYGRFSGAVMNAVTKSGTNGFHGSAFEFLRNSDFDARNFFDPTRAALRRNQYGFAVGGPFWKNKLFWFTDYQGTRQTQGQSTGSVQVPSVAERSGDFSGVPGGLGGSVTGNVWAQDLSNKLGYTVTPGETYYASGCTSSAQCVFPNGIIPSSVFATPATHLLQYIPTPNLGTNYYSSASENQTIRDDKIGERVDLTTQRTGNWSFYYTFDDSTVSSAIPGLVTIGNGATLPGFPATTPSRAQEAVLSNTHVFNPTTVNEARLSFTRYSLHLDNPTGPTPSLSSLGFVTGPGTLGIIQSGPPGSEGVPPITFNNFTLGNAQLNTFQANNTWAVTDGLSKVIGDHSIKFGGEFRYLQINERNVCNPNGAFTFNGTETGNDFADFLLGAPQQYIQCSYQLLDSRTRYGALYAQDSWRIKPNFTLNYGLRWEVSMPWYDTQNKIETIVPGLQSQVFPNSPTGWVFPGDPGVPSTLAPTRWKDFGPRVGLAWSPAADSGVLRWLTGGPGKTSIRAAYGLYYTAVEDLTMFTEVADAPYGLYWVSSAPPLFDQPFLDRQDGISQGQRFPFTLPTPGDPNNKNLSFAQFLPITSSPGYATNNVLPYAEHYNFTIQRELPKSMLLTLSYVGTQGHHLISQVEANPGNPATCLALQSADVLPNPCGPYGENVVYTVGSTVINGTRGPLGNNFGSNAFIRTMGSSSYNSLQVSLERRVSDMTFLAAYTRSKSLDNASSYSDWVNPLNYSLSRSLSAFDVPNNFVFSYIWQLPIDRTFRRGPKRLTQGWQIIGITRFANGFPVTLSEPDDRSLLGTGGNTDTPDVIAPVTTQNPRNAGPGGLANQYFSISSFTLGPLGGLGDANRRFFHGPGIINTDFALHKVTPIKESVTLEFRAEFFNIFNHTQFNSSGVIGNITSSQFGEATTARDPRIGQLSLKLLW
jgi:Carboxypeptidase regulatory-like domain